MTTAYRRGAQKEYWVKSALESIGCSCIRAASSHGLFDIVGVSGDEVWLVQAKLTKQKSFSEDDNCKLFRALPVAGNVRKQLWVFRPQVGLDEVFDLKQEKPAARSPAMAVYRQQAADRAAHLRRAIRITT